MSRTEQTELPEKDELTVSTENVGGLAGRSEFRLVSGLNIVYAPNASGKSSFIHGLETAVMDESQLKDHTHFVHSFSDQARVEIEYDEEKAVRRIYRSGNELSVGGEKLYPEGEKASLFCIATEENELLERVKSGRPLKSLLLRFSDGPYYSLFGDYLKQREEEARDELSDYRDELAELNRLNRELEEKQEELREKEQEREQLPEVDEKKLGENKELQAQLEGLYDRIENKEEEIADKENEIERSERELESARQQLEKVNQRIERFQEEHPNVEQEIEDMLDREEELGNEISELRSTLQRISDELEKTDEGLIDIENTERDTCTMCGQEITEEQMAQRAEQLAQQKDELQEDIRQKQNQLDEVEDRRQELETERRRQKDQYEEQKKQKQQEISRFESQNEELDTEVEELRNEVEELEDQVEALRPKIDSEVFDLAQQRSEIDRKIGRIDSRIDSIQQEIEEKQGVREQIEELREGVEFYESAVEYMKNEAERRERAVQEMFNEHIDEVYDLLEFDEPFESIQIDQNFDIKIYRRFQGQTEEDSIDTLSRSEKETVGLVLMLAGRSAYCDDFPFFIADETSFYDTTRLKRVMEYINARVPYTVITTLASADEKSDLSIEHDLDAIA
jgi:DNA repair exonuclease SbcCD ATPase subunit